MTSHRVTEWPCHIAMSHRSHMSQSQHVTKKSADKHEDYKR